MLRAGLPYRIAYDGLGKAQLLAGGAATVFSATLKAGTPAEIQEIHTIIGPALVWAQTHALEWLFWMVVAAGLAQVLRRYLGPPWVWQLIESSLGDFRQYVFPENADDSEEHHHRVTLFKYVRLTWAWPPKWGWLVPVARSAHTTRHGIAKFRAPDDADSAEGIAGRTWAKKNALVVSELPDLKGTSPAEDFERYARATSVNVGWLRKRLAKKPDRPFARSYGGYPVLVGGKAWGVIVLDSRSEKGVTNEKYKPHSEYYRMHAKFLGQLLERAR